MEWMDVARRTGGYAWVAAGVAFVVLVAVVRGVLPGPITIGASLLVIALAVASALSAPAALVAGLGWLTSTALGLDFLGAVADRFGILGPPGSPGVWWGDWPAFLENTSTLLHGANGWPVTAMAVAATAAEVTLGVVLLTGWQRRWAGKATAGLLVAYLLLMITSVGPTEVARFALPILVGGALLVSSLPRGRRPAAPSRTAPIPAPRSAETGA